VELKPVESSNIKAVGFDPNGRTLRVEFNSGSQYDYEDVPPTVYQEFIESPSKGRFFAQNIKGHFQCVKTS
jgi:hypothetical protein